MSVDDALERVTNLLAILLHARAPRTLQSIADEIVPRYPDDESARRTAFERDKRILRDRGVVIEQVVLSGADAGRTAYWVDRGSFELPDLGLTDDESEALRLAVAAVRLGADWGDRAVQKVTLGSDPAPVGAVASAALPSSKEVAQLLQANADRRRVRFHYRGEPREVEPWGLLAREGWWYVVGPALEKGAMRAFRVDRIDGPIDAGPPGAFEVPEGFRPESAFARDARMLRIGEVTSADVWIAPGRAATVVADLGEDAVVEQHADGAVVVRVPFANRPAFVSWVLGLLDDAVVLGPEDVRRDVVDQLRRQAAGA